MHHNAALALHMTLCHHSTFDAPLCSKSWPSYRSLCLPLVACYAQLPSSGLHATMLHPCERGYTCWAFRAFGVACFPYRPDVIACHRMSSPVIAVLDAGSASVMLADPAPPLCDF